MSQLELEITLSNLDYLASQARTAIREQEGDAKSYLELSEYYRNEGCGLFLLNMDAEGFRQKLSQSARAYLTLLHKRQQIALDEYYLCRSRALPLLDALAIGDFNLATSISENMTSEYHSQMEYEEDYCYFQMLPLFLQPIPDDDLLKSILSEFCVVTEGGDSGRYRTMEALVGRDAVLFNEQMLALIVDWADNIRRQRDSSKIDPYFDKTGASLFVEGLALVKLAKQLGMSTESQYKYIPDILLQS